MRWGEFRVARPDLAEAGRALLYQFGVGLAFLGTIRRDGGPRVHPVCPIIFHDGLFAFIIPSPKRDDLARDSRYALHAFPPADNEDAFYLTGRAVRATDETLRSAVAAAFLAERGWSDDPPDFDQQWLFEFLVESCLLTRTTGHGDFAPEQSAWRAGS